MKIIFKLFSVKISATWLDFVIANFQISERGTNERKCFKKMDICKFPILYYIQIFEKRGTHGKITLFFASK